MEVVEGAGTGSDAMLRGSTLDGLGTGYAC